MWGNASTTDKEQLYSKVVYIYFCFFSMFIAQRFSMNVTYGAALFFSLSALTRTLRFQSVKAPEDVRTMGWLKPAAAGFFVLTTAYIIALQPFLFEQRYSAYAIAIIVLPFLEREIESLLLRKRFASKAAEKRGIIKTIVPLELICMTAAGLIAMSAGIDTLVTVISGMLIGMGFHFIRQYEFKTFAAPAAFYGGHDPAGRIRSARLYDGMVISSGAAFNIFAFTYMLFIIYIQPRNFLFDFFAVFSGLALFFTVIYLSTYKIVRSPMIEKIGKNAAFVLGTTISILAVYVFRDSWFHGALAISFQTLFLMIGLILQSTAALGLKEDVFLVIKLYDPTADIRVFQVRTARLEVLTAAISETVFLFVLLIMLSTPLFSMISMDGYIVYAPYFGSSVMAIPTVFLFISLFYSLKQPLTKKITGKLKIYADIVKRGKNNPDMEKRLYNVLIKKYKKRIGVSIIRAFLKPIMYHSITGHEHVTNLPGIFVFNHGEFYGPVAAVVFLPYAIRPWIYYKMIDKKEINTYVYDGTFSKIRGMPVWMKKLIARITSPIISWALRSFEPIPVYRGNARNVIKTFALSIECLNAGDSILLFPENPEEKYGDKVNPFYSGFANLGRMFFKSSGSRVVFYPVYASKRSRVLRIGEGVKYDPANKNEERDRIVSELESRMRELESQDGHRPDAESEN